MTRKNTELANLRRPRILLIASRIGGADYRRNRDLARLFKDRRPAHQNALIGALKDMENQIEMSRKLGDGTYSARRHVQVMTALLIEAKRA
ncbi:MAG: hypothetical protein JKY31_02360 [Rhodobacteraceae bacterium]|nr:hypothetical protein [Paracoccaceae bacterium]